MLANWSGWGRIVPHAATLTSDAQGRGGLNPGRTAGLDVASGDNQTVVLGSDVAEIEHALFKMENSDIEGLEAAAEG